MLGRSDIWEGKPQAGEVPDLAPPHSHGPRYTLSSCQQLPVVDQRGGAGADLLPGLAVCVCVGGHERMEGSHQHAVSMQQPADRRQH